MNDGAYTKQLVDRLTDQSKWSSVAISGGFAALALKIRHEVVGDTISGKIAHIFVQHQLLHQITKELIELSNLYVQGEIWPTIFEPAYDEGEDRMTGWYLSYYKEHCIGCRGKEKFLERAKKLNNIRNKVAHNLIGKNEVIIAASFREFEDILGKSEKYIDECHEDLHLKLTDLNKRVDFKVFLD